MVTAVVGGSCGKKAVHVRLLPAVFSTAFELRAPEYGLFEMHTAVVEMDGKSWAYYFSKADSAIHLQSLSDSASEIISLAKLLSRRIPYSTGDPAGFVFENAHCLWIDSPLSDTLFVYDAVEKKIIARLQVQLPDAGKNREIMRHCLSAVNPPVRSGNHVYLAIEIFNPDPALITVPVRPFPVLARFRQQGEHLVFEKFIGQLPENYYRKDMYITEAYATALSGDSLLVNYFYSDSADLVTRDGTWEKAAMKSDSSKIFSGLQGKASDMNVVQKLFFAQQRYNRILYDPYRNYIYRIFLHEAPSLSNGKISRFREWSLLIFDRDLRKIGEENFDAEKYDPAEVLVTREGLAIRYTGDIQQPGGPVMIRFRLFTLKNEP